MPETRASVARTPSIVSACARQTSSPTRANATVSDGSADFDKASSRSSTPDGNADPLLIATRSLASVVRASFQPSPTSPTTHSSGTNTSLKKISLNNASPVSSRSGLTSRPSDFMSTRKYVIPLWRLLSTDVRARQMAQSAVRAPDVHTFCPDSDQPPSTRVAFVCSDARSDPAPGSLNIWHQVMSPCNVGGANRLRCSSVPY